MPDLTRHTALTCSTNIDWTGHVRGSKDRIYEVRYVELDSRRRDEQGGLYGWLCDCPAFIFGRGLNGRGVCKHVTEIIGRRDRCAWNADLEPANPPKHTKHGDVCPNCRGPVEPIEVAV
jgi:hypothetical protein